MLFLLGVQIATGIVLTLYYVPSPASAYDSVRFIMEGVTFGPIVRGLHFFGASFVVVAAVIHMLRVVLFASYKTPREVTWITGVVLLLVILAFALSGYLLPWDRGPDRYPLKRPLVTAGFALLGVAVVSLTYLGVKDTPAAERRDGWGPLAIAGQEFASDEACESCHRPGGAASPIADTRLRQDPEWLFAHVRDPEMIAPGLRPPPPGGMNSGQAYAIRSFMEAVRSGAERPMVTPQERTAARILGLYCANCHTMDGAGESAAPDLSRVGADRDAAWLREWITSPESVDPFATMPPFGEFLTDEEMDALVAYLTGRT